MRREDAVALAAGDVVRCKRSGLAVRVDRVSVMAGGLVVVEGRYVCDGRVRTFWATEIEREA